MKLPVTYDDVVTAKVRLRGSSVVQTPLLQHPELNARAGANVFVKAECLQTTGSFKIRGATNRLLQLNEDEKRAGVVAFSSGNHAQGVARAARLLDIPALIVMPSDAPEIKVAGVLADGAEIKFYDRNSESREDIAAALASERGAIVVPSFEDPHIIAGQGTVGLEIFQQMEEQNLALDALFCCAGGGGLISGIAVALTKNSPRTKIYSVEPDQHNDWMRSLESGEVKRNASGIHSICDAILTPQPGDLTFQIGQELLAGGVSVNDTDVAEAIRFAVQYLKIVLEPGGAVALAHALKGLGPEHNGSNVCVVVTGGNIDPEMLATLLDPSTND